MLDVRGDLQTQVLQRVVTLRFGKEGYFFGSTRAGLPLFSLEARVGLGSYDVLGITLPYELCYTNILTVLDLAGLPLRAADRDDGHPLVLGGGSCAFNPEPVADFFDAIVLGDGEEVIVEIADLLLGAKKEGLARAAVLDRLAAVRL